jgi:hypothetical protein
MVWYDMDEIGKFKEWKWNANVHICAKTPEDAFTVRPKVDKARKEPSKIKWMSASNV